MKMKPKMLLASTAISLGSVLLTTIGIVTLASNLAGQSLQNDLQEKLVLQRDVQKREIENYIKGINEEVARSAGLDGVFTKALLEFTNPFFNFGTQVPQLGRKYQESVTNFYTDQFAPRYIERNANVQPLAANDVMAQLNSNTVALQNYFISSNPNPLGEKEKLIELKGVNADYAKVHAKYHPRFTDYLNKWGFYDVFLVDAKTGFVVYSVYKELDYATSLINGPYSNSGLGKAFQQAISTEMQGQSYMTNMSPYYPSYNDFAAFVSSPLYNNGKLQGVFIIQMPLDKINNVMTFDQNWEKFGLGKSGETYLVADDFTMRNDSRFLIEDLKGYSAALRKANIPQAKINTIVNKGTSIGLQTVNSIGVKKALAGETGFSSFLDYRDVPVFSAYAPMKVLGLNWAVLAEIDEEEANAPILELINEIILIAVIIGLVLLALGALLSLFMVNNIVNPITYFKNIMDRYKAGENDLRVKSKADDEIGELATAFDELLDERATTLEQITTENDMLNESVLEMLQVASQLSQGDLTQKMTVTEDVTGPLADSLNLVMDQTGQALKEIKQTAGEVEVSAKIVKQQSDTVVGAAEQESAVVKSTVQDLAVASEELNRIAELAKQCNIAADETIVSTDEAQNTVLASVEGINNIRDNISETEKRIKRLGERSQEIAGVTGIINGIAEKTHVLSLNASMQAASAGEAGRGFAVVATEIQRLAESATEATTEIGTLIKNIQVDTADTVNAMNNAITQVVEGTRMAENAGSQMQETRNKSNELVGLVQQIAASSENQVVVSKNLQQQASEIQQSNEETTKQLELQALQTDSLVEYSADMLKAIEAFKLPG